MIFFSLFFLGADFFSGSKGAWGSIVAFSEREESSAAYKILQTKVIEAKNKFPAASFKLAASPKAPGKSSAAKGDRALSAGAAKAKEKGAASKNAPLKKVHGKESSSKGTAAKKSSRRLSGHFQVPSVKKKDLLSRMGFKKGDVVKRFNEESVLSKKSFFRQLRRMKSKRSFSIDLERGGRDLRFAYKRGAKNRFRLSKKSSLKKSSKIAGSSKIADKRKSSKKENARRESSRRPAGFSASKSGSKLPASAAAPAKKAREPDQFALSSAPKRSVLSRMGLKKGDVIKRLNEKPVPSRKAFLRRLGWIKPKKKFSVDLERGGRDLRFVYERGSKKRFRLIEKTSLGDSEKPPVRKLSGKKTKSGAGWKKKRKRLLQNGYVIALKTLVYDKPDFDAKQIHALPSGTKTLMSKKIVRPKHRFGSFYKIFITEPKKIVGYISEVEVIPQFVKYGKRYFPNPRYKMAAKQIDKEGAVDLQNLLKKEKPYIDEDSRSLPPSEQSAKYRYAGFSAGLSNFSFSRSLLREDFHLGLKFSGYNLLISSWNMDYNLSFSLFNPYYWHGDIMTGYAFFRGMKYHIYLLAGLQLNVDINSRSSRIYKVAPGMIGALSVFAPFTKRLIFRADLRGACEFWNCKGTLAPGALMSFQIGF